jgi:hypothetical protein
VVNLDFPLGELAGMIHPISVKNTFGGEELTFYP